MTNIINIVPILIFEALIFTTFTFLGSVALLFCLPGTFLYQSKNKACISRGS